ncbi:MAG: alanyl-tRNA editing protein [Eubacteriales bacterium]|nr:alanyl-tRNA editing protein [Eubacteriales bacterium]
MTEKLFYQDSHLREFTAVVISCEWNEKKQCYEVILDRTAFFPEGGGQYADGGVLDGMKVEDVRERGGEILHLLKKPLEPGRAVKGRIDYEERFSRMQQHSGEHIVSGLVHRHFGYDNVGFHLGQELVTMDFNGSLTGEQLMQVELEANQAVAANLEIQVSYPDEEELAALDYRSKKEIDGQVRIVTVPGYDVCACCAPHVSRTGEIGMIRLTDAVKYKGGTRVTMVCGFRALKDYHVKEQNIREISRLLSARPCETADAVRRLSEEAELSREKLIRFQTRMMEEKLKEIPADAKNYILFEEELDKNAARRFVDAAMGKCGGVCGLFLGNDEQGYQFILGSKTVSPKEVLNRFYQEFEGKGGGRGEMVQGTAAGRPGTLAEDIRGFFA